MPATAFPGMWEMMILAMSAGLIIIPFVVVVLLFIWLSNKKRRDEMVIEQLVLIKQRLETIHERLARETKDHQGKGI